MKRELKREIYQIESRISSALKSGQIPPRFVIPTDCEIQRDGDVVVGREFIKIGDDGKPYLPKWPHRTAKEPEGQAEEINFDPRNLVGAGLGDYYNDMQRLEGLREDLADFESTPTKQAINTEEESNNVTLRRGRPINELVQERNSIIRSAATDLQDKINDKVLRKIASSLNCMPTLKEDPWLRQNWKRQGPPCWEKLLDFPSYKRKFSKLVYKALHPKS
jgi:hypothetical protein